MTEKSPSTIECPVCWKWYPTEIIQSHVNVCLEENPTKNVPFDSEAHARGCKADEYGKPGHFTAAQITPYEIDDEQLLAKKQCCDYVLQDLFNRSDEVGLVATSKLTARKVASCTQPQTESSGTTKKSGTMSSDATRNSAIDFFSPKRRRVSDRGWTQDAVSPTVAVSGSGIKTSEVAELSNGSSNIKDSLCLTRKQKPLADEMRPKSLEEFVGQGHILSSNCMLRRVIQSDEIPSMILWGPPGCGKTSLAHVISLRTLKGKKYKFVSLSATNAGVNDVKDVVKHAKHDLLLLNRKTILFIDEIHRFNKLQQDVFLPCVENGTITLIGATTENPSFSLNSALLSRCRVFVLEKLTAEEVEQILRRALKMLAVVEVANVMHGMEQNFNGTYIETSALTSLAHLTDGDARIALNCLNLSVQSVRAEHATPSEDGAAARGNTTSSPVLLIGDKHIKESLQRTHLLYDRKGDEHFNCISALHKSMRGSDADAALYWLGRILVGGEDPRYVARRLIRFASEDIGMADPFALNQAVATYEACQFIGMPECDVILAQCVVYLSEAAKSTRIYKAYSKVKECILSHKGPLPGVPLHLRNAPTKLMKDLGYAKDYKYNPNYSQPVDQEYLPECLKGKTFLEKPNNRKK